MNGKKELNRFLYIILSVLTLFSCSNDQNFTQFPGFTDHFSKFPPSDSVPTAEEISLLDKFKPLIYLAVDQPKPIDFYAEYISQGTLTVEGRRFEKKIVSAELLNKHRDNPAALFRYTGDYRKSGISESHISKIYARIDYEQVEHQNKHYDFTFLTYNLVFPVSGILDGLGSLSSFALTVSGNLDDWHQLDHYVAVSVALLDNKVVAMTLQQHNYQTTYLLAEHSVANSEIAVDIARRSNELYPHNSEEKRHPAVSFLTHGNLEFVMNGNNKPMMAGFDITHGEIALDYTLEYLPQTDAFYQFKGSLGKKRLLPGRSGPPGADYATLPGLMPRFVRLVTGYRPGPPEREIELYSALIDQKNFLVREQAIEPYKTRFFEAM